ncbi:hypothetical protein SLA2020_447110 [Shorea laevis]
MSNLALVLLVLALCMSTQPLICNAYRVHIENGFQKAILGAHCKSRDNDLGLHLIPAHSEYYWSFDGNFIRTTLYFCDFSWEGGHRTFDVFKYDDGFLSKYCPHLIQIAAGELKRMGFSRTITRLDNMISYISGNHDILEA